MAQAIRRVTIPYKPRPLWAKVIHPALDAHRFAVLVCHRRFGKTVGTVNQMIKRAIQCDKPAPHYCYVAPYRNQAKMIAWQYLLHYTSVIPGVKKNESDLFVELPSQKRGWPGARLHIIGADHPDALRGTYWDGAVLDEYAQIKPELWSEVIRPALADRGGWAVFIGTPKGQNAFYEMYQRALADSSWFSCLYRADESGVLPQDELDEMRKDMTDLAVRQELLCDFSASASDVVLPIDLVSEAAARELIASDVAGQPVLMGVDVARFGDDATVISIRQGLHALPQKVFRGLDTMQAADRVIVAMAEHKPAAVFIDVGAMGAGVIDRLRQLHYNVTEVNFAGSAMDSERYANRRAEMYFKLREWMQAGGAIPNETTLKSELSVVEYKFTPAGKIILEPKDKVKEKIGKSPDLADSLALTFAMPIYTPGAREIEDEEEPYNPLKNYMED